MDVIYLAENEDIHHHVLVRGEKHVSFYSALFSASSCILSPLSLPLSSYPETSSPSYLPPNSLCYLPSISLLIKKVNLFSWSENLLKHARQTNRLIIKDSNITVDDYNI